MDNVHIVVCIAVMAVITYLIRALPLALFKKKITNRYVRSFLAYVPYAVLAAMTFPEVLYSTSNMLAAVIGTVAALILAYFGRGLLTVALGGAATVFVAEQAIRLLLS